MKKLEALFKLERQFGGVLDIDGEIFNENDPDLNYTRRLS